jgi:flagellin
MAALRHNQSATDLQADSFRKLSSGSRVYNASQDAAGLAVANNLDVRATSQTMAMRNANDGISIVQTAEGGINEISAMVRRMRELAIQSSSDTLAATERAYVNDEFSDLQEEIKRIRDSSNFNGINLLDGNIAGGLEAQVGADNNVNNRIAIVVQDVTKVVDSALGVPFNLSDQADLKVDTLVNAQATLNRLDDALKHMNNQRSKLGSVENKFNNAISYLANNNEAMRAAESRIMDVDFAHASAQMSKAQTMSQASTAILAQANQLPQMATRLIG